MIRESDMGMRLVCDTCEKFVSAGEAFITVRIDNRPELATLCYDCALKLFDVRVLRVLGMTKASL